jgi:hypothetical protein
MMVQTQTEFDAWYKDYMQLQHPGGTPAIAAPAPAPADAPVVGGGTPKQQGSAPAVEPKK